MTLSRRHARALLGITILVAGVSIWMASARLDSQRAWDERWTLSNVHSILTTGDFRPVTAWYPSLSHLPGTALMAGSQALYRLSGAEPLAVLGPTGELTPTAYLLGRLLSVVYAVGTLLLTFHLARRLLSPEVGLLSVLLLASGEASHMERELMEGVFL